MLKMMSYRQANKVLASLLSPDSRCISKGVAIDSKASLTVISDFITDHPDSGEFSDPRLMPIKAIQGVYENDGKLLPVDDYILKMSATGSDTTKLDSMAAGYKYVIDEIRYETVDANGNVTITNAEPVATVDNVNKTTTYSAGWVSVTIKDDDGTNNPNGDYYVYLNANRCVSSGIEYNAQDNTGYRRNAKILFSVLQVDINGQNLSSILSDCMSLNDMWLPFYVTVTLAPASGYNDPAIGKTLASFDSSVNNLTFTMSYDSAARLDTVIYMPGSNFYGRWWDKTGFHNGTSGEPTSDPDVLSALTTMRNSVNIANNTSSNTVSIDFDSLVSGGRAVAQATGTPFGTSKYRFIVFSNWDKMESAVTADKHLIPIVNNGRSTVSAVVSDGNTNKTINGINIYGAGNLNVISDNISLAIGLYTSVCEIIYTVSTGTVEIKELDSFDSWKSSGSYAILYPKYDTTNNWGLVRSDEQNDTERKYSATVTGNSVTITINSEIRYSDNSGDITIQKYFPEDSITDQEQYNVTVDGQTYLLGNTSTIDVPVYGTEKTITIDFSSVSTKPAVRWIRIKQENSNEYADLSFTFNL